ncbi:MAG: sulfotransferase [Gammaproteobacteria bacterium]|nr:sulfotransferase [Gammaproteobacteria bacterium]MDH4253532.1 sulfotransferase [Gammaproteobacteria bacterium]MDH5309874.1 sulfotransferase [Gammaproteobacteria bacterium]
MDESGATGDLQTALRHAAALLRIDPAAAAAQARAILTVIPDEPHAGVLLAAAERRSGRVDRAIDLASAVVASHPGMASAREELGLALLAAGRWIEAEAALTRAVGIDDRLATAWVALADLRGNFRGEAGDRLGNAALYPGQATAGALELARAADALLTDDLATAERLCREILKREPRDVAAIRLLADAGVRLGRLDEAEELLSYCLELAPDFHLARHSYAHLLLRKLRFREALAQIDRVLDAEPNRPSHLLLRAAILSQVGETAAAIDIYDAMLRQFPGEARLHLGRGNALKTVGRNADAVAAYRTAIDSQPAFGEAYWSLSNLKTFKFDDADVSRMRELLAADDVSRENYFQLSFALGKALEDRGEFDESFRHYANGNAARRRSVQWDADEHHADIERVRSFFQPGFFESQRDAGNPSPAPIFIVGLPRAGSTLLEQILASHSRVEGTMELPDIMAIGRRLGGGKKDDRATRYPGVLATFAAADFEALGTEYLERTAVHRAEAPYFIDKMPNNFIHVGLIHLLLPNAKIIDARRHPMGCCFSVFKQLFAHGQNFSYSLEDIGRYYRDYLALMAHWDAVLPGRVLRVEYESMVENTEAEVRRLLAYCGLDFEPACLEFHRTERAVRTASSEQVRQPIYASAVEQWRNFEAHLAPLAKALGMDM